MTTNCVSLVADSFFFLWERTVLFAFRCAVFLSAVLTVCIPFPFGFWGGCEIRLYRFLIIAFSSTFILLQNTDLSPKRSAPLAYKHRRVTMATNGNVIRCNFQTLGRSYIVFIFIDALIIEMHISLTVFQTSSSENVCIRQDENIMVISWLAGLCLQVAASMYCPAHAPWSTPLVGTAWSNGQKWWKIFFKPLLARFNRDTIYSVNNTRNRLYVLLDWAKIYMTCEIQQRHSILRIIPGNVYIYIIGLWAKKYIINNVQNVIRTEAVHQSVCINWRREGVYPRNKFYDI